MRYTYTIDLADYWNKLLSIAKNLFRIDLFLALYLAVHMLQIAFPSDGSMIFDEAHYVPASVMTLQGIAANAEHPPLPKIIGAIGIALIGNNWFGWRFPQVAMQVAALYLFYLIAKRFLGHPWDLGATVLLAFDTVWFIHGGALLIDMTFFLFSFLAIEFYLRNRYGWSAVSMGMAFFAREMAVWWFPALAAYHLVKNRKTLKPTLKLGLRYSLIVLLVLMVCMFAYDMKYQPVKSASVTNIVLRNVVLSPNGTAVTTTTTTSQSISREVMWNPIDHLMFIARYHGPEGIVTNASYTPYSYAWNWIIPNDPFNSPTYYRVDVTARTGDVVMRFIPIWYRSQANLALWYGIWPAVVGLLYVLFKGKEGKDEAFFMLSGILLNYMPWVMLSILTHRMGFNYYMIYTLPFIALGLASTWKLLPKTIGTKILVANILLAAAFFIWFFPVRPMP